MMTKTTSSTRFIVGESHGFHDGAYALLNKDGSVWFAEHTERFSKIKHDLNPHPIAKTQGANMPRAFYEKPLWRQARQWLAGEKVRPKAKDYDYYIEHHWAHGAACRQNGAPSRRHFGQEEFHWVGV